jgi:hypothetical protein
MKSVFFLTAVMFAGAAAAQSYGTQPTTPPSTTDTTQATTTMAPTTAPVTTMSNADIPNPGEQVAPGNESPERDARGIAVVSDAATVPTGFNVEGGVGGPLETSAPATTQPADAEYPACSRTVTDNCVQTYERGRSPN